MVPILILNVYKYFTLNSYFRKGEFLNTSINMKRQRVAMRTLCP